MAGVTKEVRAQNRQRLLDAAAAIVAEQGFHQASIDDIAARAGLTKGAVYSHFKNKEEVLLALLAQRSDETKAHTKEVLSRDTSRPDRLGQLYERSLAQVTDVQATMLQFEFFAYALRHPDLHDDLIARGWMSVDWLGDVIRENWERAGVTRRVDPRVFAVMLNGATTYCAMLHAANPGGDAARLHKTALQFLVTAAQS